MTANGTKVISITYRIAPDKRGIGFLGRPNLFGLTQAHQDDAEDDEDDQADEQSKINDGYKLQLAFKGLGISFIDNQPKEVMYASLDDVNVMYSKLKSRDEITEEKVAGPDADELSGSHQQQKNKKLTEIRTEMIVEVGNL